MSVRDVSTTTATEESVRRAVAIALIINREFGLNFCENPWQGSFVVDKLTNLVEEAVYKEFEANSGRDGVLGAMDTLEPLFPRGRGVGERGNRCPGSWWDSRRRRLTYSSSASRT